MDVLKVSNEEQNNLNDISFFLSTANDIDTLLDTYLNNIDDNIDNTKKKIETHFQLIIQQLHKQKKQLNKQIDSWKINKMEQIKQEKSNIIHYKNTIQTATTTCNQLIKTKNDDNERSTQIKQITLNILDNKQYKKYQKTQEISKHLETIVTSPDIIFKPEINCSNISSFGEIQSIFVQNIFNPPIITLASPIKHGECINGYNIRLQWKLTESEREHRDDHHFIIKYQELTAGFDDIDDEKKAMEYETELFWKTLRCSKIECFDRNIFATNCEKTFSLNRRYQFKVETMVRNPMHLKIESNIEDIFIDKDNRPKGDIVQIELKCIGHRSDNNGAPINLLVNDDSYYWSAFYSNFGKDENDWITFEMNGKDAVYFPVRFEICNHSGYQKQGVKSMNIWIGNKENGEWYQYNEGMEPIIVQLTDEYQSFSMCGVHSDIIKNKKLSVLRLEFVKNWGFSNEFGSKFACKEFKMFGIKF